MQLRRAILKFLLASLALAAIAGVLAVLLPTRDVVVRVMLTGLTTAGAALLMILFTFLLPRPKVRPAGLYGLCVTLVEFVICLGLIWLDRVITWEDELAMTGVMLGMVSLAVLSYLCFIRYDRSRVAAWVGVVSSAAAYGLYLAAIWVPGGMWSRGEWWGSGWLVGSYGVIAAACLTGVGYAPRHAWRWVGTLLTIVGASIVMVEIWDRQPGDELDRAAVVVTSAACVIGLVSLSLIAALKPGQAWVRVVTIIAASATAILIDVVVVAELDIDDGVAARMIAATAIVTGCGSLAMIVLVALNRRGAIDPSTAALMDISIICPICRTRQSVPVGASACRGCGLRMEIRLEEPRCPQCDYLLYQLASDNCPECGATIVGAGS